MTTRKMDVQEPTDSAPLKRKRSLSIESPRYATPSAKVARPSQTAGHLEVNYLARHLDDDLPLLTPDDTLPSILFLLGEYDETLERHESLAYNLGARLLGPMLIKRVERIFDGPPKVVESHVSRHGHSGIVTWSDVIEYARIKPDQFMSGRSEDGLPIRDFYTKQCRVQISEEEFKLIESGIPQKMIPPQPITEDEEKELGTLEILDLNVQQISALADQVAARARQFNHRILSRKQAIIERRAANTALSGATPLRASSPSINASVNGPHLQSPLSPPGFVAVNSRPLVEHNTEQQSINGHSNSAAVSPSVRDELLRTFSTTADRRQAQNRSNGMSYVSVPHQSSTAASPGGPYSIPRSSRPSIGPRVTTQDDQQLATSLISYNDTTTALPNLPAQSMPQQTHRASIAEKDDGGPFRVEMVARLESIPKGERISPPCDRCRRLHMECRKNLTACIGCTKKHAKCSWRDVREDELRRARALGSNNYSNGETNPGTRRDSFPARSPRATESSSDDHSRQQDPHFDPEYSYEKQFRTHDEEMQAARSLAMAAVADAATQAQMQMQMQRDASVPCDVSNGELSPNVHPGSAISNSDRVSGNLDPSLQPLEPKYGVRSGG